MSDYYLFGTEGCHLCEDAEKLIHQYPRQLQYQHQDIADNEVWLAKYATRIPVLFHLQTKAELNWPFDSTQLADFIVKCQQTMP